MRKCRKIDDRINKITYISGSRSYQQGEFPLWGKRPEQVVYEFWKLIKRESPFDAELEKVLCESEDITVLVKKLEIQEDLERSNYIEDLPF